MAKDKGEVLAEIRGSFARGVEHYNRAKLQGDTVQRINLLKEAEEEFVKVLRPMLSKPLMRLIHPENIPAVKSELLGAMYHLGEIYLKDAERLDHHSKAAAIFQYCTGFATKYDVAIEVKGQLADSDYFLHRAYDVERQFLAQVPDVTVTNWAEEDCMQKSEGYKAELLEIREETKKRLEKISDLGVEQIAGRAEAVEDIYKTSSQFFVDHQQAPISLAAPTPVMISKGKAGNGFIQRLLSECHDQMGNPPEGCEYSIVGLGSLALGTMTPWSDLEFAVLIRDDREDYREYFRNLTKLLHIKIINLGETPLRSVGIESLNNFRTAEPGDDWFWDDVIESGFSFDGPDWHACKHPLGRQGYKEAKKEKNEQGAEVITSNPIIEDKPDYELILTPQQLVSWQFVVEAPETEERTAEGERAEKSIDESHPTFATDRHLVQALRSVALIDGSQSLLDEYRDHFRTYSPPEGRSNELQEHALAILQENIDEFSLKLGDKEEGKLLDVKKDIYRLGDRVVTMLADYYGITAEPGHPAINVWQMVDAMWDQKKLSTEGAQHLKEALGIATELRLSTYANNESQGEMMSSYRPAVGHLTEEQKHQLLEKTFHIKDTGTLHHFYYVMLRVQGIVQIFCDQDQHDRAEMVLVSDDLYGDSNYNKGMVHSRFLGYEQAMKFLEKAKTEQPENLQVFLDLYLLYFKTRIIDKSIDIAKETQTLMQTQNQDDPNHPNIAGTHSNLGNAYTAQKRYEEAIQEYQIALEMYKVAYASTPGHPEIASIHNNLGNAYRNKGEYDAAIQEYNKALEIYKVAYALTPDHPDIAGSYNNLGNAYRNKGEYDAAIQEYNKALEIRLVAYASTPNHPDIAMSYDNLGLAYNNKEEYDVAIKEHKKALEIYKIAYASTPGHPDIAMSYNNLGNAYSKTGEYDAAIQEYNKALEIYKVAYASMPVHPDIAMSYDNLGLAYFCKGEYDKALSCVKSGNVYIGALVQLGNQALLANNQDQAKEFYKQIDQELEQIDFSSEEFIQLQFEAVNMAYKNCALLSAINCQLVLIKIDPTLRYANHHHNLAVFYAIQGNVEEANSAFLQGLEYHGVTSGLHAEYAQFLILNRDNPVLSDAVQTISDHLYSVIASENIGGLSYGRIERNSVCEVLSNLTRQKNATIQVNPKVLAYYLLITHPEYIREGESVDDLLETFREYCGSLQDVVGFTLLADSCEHVGNTVMADEYHAKVQFMEQVDDVLAGKLRLQASDDGTTGTHVVEVDLNLQMVTEYATQLEEAAKTALSTRNLGQAVEIYTKLFQISREILPHELEFVKSAADNLSTISFLTNNIQQYLGLKYQLGAELNTSLIELAGQEVATVLAIEQQITDQRAQQMKQQALAAAQEASSEQVASEDDAVVTADDITTSGIDDEDVTLSGEG